MVVVVSEEVAIIEIGPDLEFATQKPTQYPLPNYHTRFPYPIFKNLIINFHLQFRAIFHFGPVPNFHPWFFDLAEKYGNREASKIGLSFLHKSS